MTPAAVRPYHHGDLRNALVEAGVELAREGGPQAIVLRESARRVGVSPNAAYRHFAALPDLVAAVGRRALEALAESMRREIGRCKPTGDPGEDAWQHAMAVGRGYVAFAMREPGLFMTGFDQEAHKGVLIEPEAFEGPYQILTVGLTKLVDVGWLPAEQLEAAHSLCWSTVHGLSMLLLGPMNALKGAARKELIESTLEQIGYGLFSGRRA